MRILVLSTWFPYPKNQGSKIRAYHLIRALARDHELTLISFEDQPIHPEWLAHMRQYCRVIEVLPEKPFDYNKWRTRLGFLSLKPAAVFAGYNKNMERLVRRTAQDRQPDLVFAFTNVTAPYALKIPNVKRVVDIDNLLALMLKEEIAFAANWRQKLRRYLAWWKFRRYEDRLYRAFDRCLVVSPLDVERVQTYTAIDPAQLMLVPNGVDLEEKRVSSKGKVLNEIIYNGALSYHANFDAMKYFLTEIFPIILKTKPSLKLVITGKTNGAAIDELPHLENICFSGYVNDINPLVSRSQICVVPLRQGAGTRLKILEAMALGTAVVSTSKGAEGLSVRHGEHILIADSPQTFAESVTRLLTDEKLRSDLEQNALKLAETVYDWKIIESDFADALRTLQAD